MHNLKLARRAKKLTQQAVADALGIERSSYARYESGARQPDFETLAQLSELLEATTEYLLGTDIPKQSDSRSLQSDELLRAYEVLASLSPESFAKAIDYIELLKRCDKI